MRAWPWARGGHACRLSRVASRKHARNFPHPPGRAGTESPARSFCFTSANSGYSNNVRRWLGRGSVEGAGSATLSPHDGPFAQSFLALQPHLFSKAWFETHLRDMTLGNPEMFTDNRCVGGGGAKPWVGAMAADECVRAQGAVALNVRALAMPTPRSTHLKCSMFEFFVQKTWLQASNCII
jgi:hypothetical protein